MESATNEGHSILHKGRKWQHYHFVSFTTTDENECLVTAPLKDRMQNTIFYISNEYLRKPEFTHTCTHLTLWRRNNKWYTFCVYGKDKLVITRLQEGKCCGVISLENVPHQNSLVIWRVSFLPEYMEVRCLFCCRKRPCCRFKSCFDQKVPSPKFWAFLWY